MPRTLPLLKPTSTSDVEALLRSGSAGTTVVACHPKDIVFSQGAPADSVMYLQNGTIKLSVLSRDGQEAVVAILEAGAFFGESVLAGGPVRHDTATAMTAATVLVIPNAQMIGLLREQQAFADRFIVHTLSRGMRLEADLADQLFHSTEQRLARALLLLAHGGHAGQPPRVLPRISQQTIADMVGTTRSRVNFFMNKFKKLGYIECGGGLKVNDALTTVILRNEQSRVRPSKTG